MAHKILGVLLIVTLAIILLISDRDWVLSNRPTIAHVADIPDGRGELLSNLRPIIVNFGVHVPHPPSKAETLYYILARAGRVPAPPPDDRRAHPSYGYSIREITFFGMPFAWYTEGGYALYLNDRHRLVFAPLAEEYDRQLYREAGRDLRQGFVFPFWQFAWGWLYVAALGLWGWLYQRAVVRRRAELGLI